MTPLISEILQQCEHTLNCVLAENIRIPPTEGFFWFEPPPPSPPP